MSAPDLLLVLLVAVPAVVGAVLVLAGPSRWSAAAGVATLAAAATASVPAVVAGAEVSAAFVAGSRWGLTTSGPAEVLLPTVLVVATLVLVVAGGVAETREPRFTGLMLLFTAAAALTVLATSLPGLLVGWELMGAASYALIGYRYADPGRVASGATAFLTTRAADLGLYLATAAALAGGTDLSLDALAGIEGGWRDVAAAGVLVAALGKAAQLPFSFWLARAMDGPSPVSALLHSAAMVAMGGYLLVRVSPLLAATGWAAQTTAWLGVATAVVLGMVALAQRDLKQLLAASTSAQLGFVVLAAGRGRRRPVPPTWSPTPPPRHCCSSRPGRGSTALGSEKLDGCSGAARRWPVVGVPATVAALLALAGLAPLSLWATKDAVLAGALETSAWLCTPPPWWPPRSRRATRCSRWCTSRVLSLPDRPSRRGGCRAGSRWRWSRSGSGRCSSVCWPYRRCSSGSPAGCPPSRRGPSWSVRRCSCSRWPAPPRGWSDGAVRHPRRCGRCARGCTTGCAWRPRCT